MNTLTNADLKYLLSVMNGETKRLDNILHEKLAPGLKPIYRKEYKKALKMFETLSKNIVPKY